MNNPCLLLMDYQVDVCSRDGAIGKSGMGSEVERRSVLQNASTILGRARDTGIEVIHVRVAFDDQYSNMTSASPRFQQIKKGGLLRLSDSAAGLCSEVAPSGNEPVVTKGCVNPFIGTNLINKLVMRQSGHLFMGGVATNHVVESAARTAADMGWEVTVLEDLCAAQTMELHEFAITQTIPTYAHVATSSAVRFGGP